MNLLQKIRKSKWIIQREIDRRLYKFYVDHYPKHVLSKKFFCQHGYSIDWKNPKSINEKILWQEAYTDTSVWSILADKLLVRDYVRGKGYDHLLVPLLGKYKDANEIDFSLLPDKFVLKCNHDCGSTVIVQKCNVDENVVKKSLNNCLNKKYGYHGIEPFYNRINPCILAEEYLDGLGGVNSSSAVDYKVFCFNGKPYCILVIWNRTKEYINVAVYDDSWVSHPDWMVFSSAYRQGDEDIARPEKLDEMLGASAQLSTGFPHVRIDFYISDGKLYFGEMTFSSAAGGINYFSEELLLKMGDMTDLSLVKKKSVPFFL